MSIWNTHSKSLPQIIEEVLYFNNTGASVTLRKGDALHYDPAMLLSTGGTDAITADYFGDVWATAAGGALPVAARARLAKRVIADGLFEFAGVILEDQTAIANDTGRWIKVAAPGSVAQCYLATGSATTTLGARQAWDAGDIGFAAATATFAGAGIAVALEVVNPDASIHLCWCKLMVGDASTATTGGLNMVAD